MAEGYAGKDPSPDEMQKMVRDIADVAYDYMGVSQADVPFGFQPSHEFKVGDKTFRSGGTFYHHENRIALTEGQSPVAGGVGIGGLVSHEVMHAKYHAVTEAYRVEQEDLARLTRNDEVDIGDIMHPDGRIKEAYREQFPIHTAMPYGLGGSYSDLKKDDGITDYSREWWQAANDGKANGEIAVNETLAEMAALDWQGVLPRLLWFKRSKSYKPFYEAIHKLYPQIVAKAAEEKAAGGKFPTNFTTLTNDMRDLGFTQVFPVRDKGLLIVGYGKQGDDFAATIDTKTNTWSGTWGPNRTKMDGEGRDSLKKALVNFKRGVDPT